MLCEWTLTTKNLLFPIFCKECGCRLLTDENGFFCPTCWEFSPRISRPFCTMCGRPHRGAVGFGTLANFPCAACRERPIAHVRRIYGAAMYDGVIEEAIKLFKFHDKPRLARPLAVLMAEFAVEELDCEQYDYLIPVPLHKVRQRDRGYNQSYLLTEELLGMFPNARLDQSLRRTRPTPAQSLLESEAQRRDNVRGAFAVHDAGHLRDKTVLLIDDVVTTAGTVSEAASTLRLADVAAVDVLTVALAARAPVSQRTVN